MQSTERWYAREMHSRSAGSLLLLKQLEGARGGARRLGGAVALHGVGGVRTGRLRAQRQRPGRMQVGDGRQVF